MKYVSCRKAFDSVDGAPVDNQIWFGKLGKRTTGAVEFVMVHGYNCQAENVCDAYRANAEMMREMGITLPPVGFLWPGLGANVVETMEFHRAQAQAHNAAKQLASYLNDGPPSVVMTHSLGAQVALDAAHYFGAKIKLLLLTGAAVSANCFDAEYADIHKNVDKIHVFWSNRDPVLAKAFFLDQWSQALGHSGPTNAVVPWIQNTNVSDVVYEHNQYRFDRVIWEESEKEILKVGLING